MVEALLCITTSARTDRSAVGWQGSAISGRQRPDRPVRLPEKDVLLAESRLSAEAVMITKPERSGLETTALPNRRTLTFRSRRIYPNPN
jgi:hypothetical protein